MKRLRSGVRRICSIVVQVSLVFLMGVVVVLGIREDLRLYAGEDIQIYLFHPCSQQSRD